MCYDGIMNKGLDRKGDNMKTKEEALANYLGCTTDEIREESFDYFGLPVYSHGKAEYTMGTYEESEAATRDAILDSLWAFTPSFLANATDLDECIFKALQDKCEDSNDSVRKLVEKTCGIDYIVQEAILSDGAGHFLAMYDGQEIEEGDYFIYRIN